MSHYAGTKDLWSVAGRVSAISPAALTVSGLSRFVRLGSILRIGEKPGALAEVIRVDTSQLVAKMLHEGDAVAIDDLAWRSNQQVLQPCRQWLGRTINALGEPIDERGPLARGADAVPLDAAPPASMHRSRARSRITTGVRVIDIFTPLCAGQRMGVFAGSGVGKSTLLGMLARAEGFDVVVIALVGERGREVREFIEDILGQHAGKAVVVVATSDESAMFRRMAPKSAMAVAEYFRDQGDSVLLIVDSITRYAHALREVALAAGEPPVARGYTPNVFSELPRLLERAGPGLEGAGSITGIFSVLVDGDDHNDPVADSVRGTLDGHIVLDRTIMNRGQYPAINVLASISRLAQHAWSQDQATLVTRLKAMISSYEETRDLRSISGHQAGGDPELDQAVLLTPKIYAALSQSPSALPSADAFRELAEFLSQSETKSN
ncbi:MAG: flagellar protein export ATPase FliI [Beijerinckiaceae bacterium]